MNAVDHVIADVLGISLAKVSDELSFSSIPEWDSLNHVNLMLALEQQYGTEIDEDRMVELTSVAAIRRFVLEPQGEAA
jgi:citrate synthase